LDFSDDDVEGLLLVVDGDDDAKTARWDFDESHGRWMGKRKREKR
jgi:hypothetical protein